MRKITFLVHVFLHNFIPTALFLANYHGSEKTKNNVLISVKCMAQKQLSFTCRKRKRHVEQGRRARGRCTDTPRTRFGVSGAAVCLLYPAAFVKFQPQVLSF